MGRKTPFCLVWDRLRGVAAFDRWRGGAQTCGLLYVGMVTPSAFDCLTAMVFFRGRCPAPARYGKETAGRCPQGAQPRKPSGFLSGQGGRADNTCVLPSTRRGTGGKAPAFAPDRRFFAISSLDPYCANLRFSWWGRLSAFLCAALDPDLFVNTRGNSFAWRKNCREDKTFKESI